MIRRRLIVTGRVQGVYYRDWFVTRMRTLGVNGWVRNRADGSVEAVIECQEGTLAAAVAAARKGSPPSRVDDVAVSEEAADEPLEGFERRRTL